MTQTFTPPKTKPNGHNDQERDEKKMGMVELAEKEIRFHTQPLPEAEEPPVDPFPAALWRGLLAGLLVGSLLGLLFGVLLFRNILVIPGWEGLYSMGPYTFHVFWLFIGAAVGVITVGIAAIIQAPVRSLEEGNQDQ